MKLTLLSSLLLAGVYVNAQPTMVGDINPIGSANPTWLTDYGNKILFFADNGTTGNELYGYDTAFAMQYDLNPGMAAGAAASNHKSMAVVGKDVYFPGDNGNTGIELFKWDGSSVPVLVTDVRAGNIGSNIDELIVFGGKVYFNANNGTNGNELWCFDPATGLSQRLTDLATGSGSSNPHNFIIYKSKLYFTASGTATGTELYYYDPVNNTTTLAVDVVTGVTGSDPQATTIINDKLYFSASTIQYGRELYMFDGKNLSRLTDIDNAAGDGVAPVSAGQVGIYSFKNVIVFAGSNANSGNQLFQYNPANGVTSMLYMINPIGSGNPANFTTYAGKMFFSADDGVQGSELWMYDGVSSPMMVADIDPGANSSSPMNMLRYTTNLFFSASTASSGRELYKLTDSAALGIQNIRFNAEVTVYPNPTAASAQIKMNLHNEQAIAITLTDLTGKTIYNTGVQQYNTGAHTVALPMADLAAGIYMYTLRNNAGTTLLTGRISKQ